MRTEQNQLLTRIGPGAPCGLLMRHYWQPVAVVDEFDGAVYPDMALRPVKALRVLGMDLVLFKDAAHDGSGEGPATYGLLDRACPHRGADLSFGRRETLAQGGGLRCPFHGWKFAPNGQCLETPAEAPLPDSSGQGRKFCDGIRQRSYPLQVHGGVIWAWLGPEQSTPPPFPLLDCFKAPASHSFAFKGLWHCNWLQAFEVGIDPAHPSFLHVFFEDEALNATGSNAAGRQFRSGSAGDVGGERWPMSRIMRELNQPEITVEPTALGMQLTALRKMNANFTHVRVTHSVFPQAFVIPLSETATITQYHLPVDDTHTYWFSIFTSFAGPLDQNAMRSHRLKANPAPSFAPLSGRHNNWGFNAAEQASTTFLGMGEEDINVHDQWACESMGAIADRTKEHLGSSDRAIIAYRRTLAKAIEAVQAGGVPPGVANPEVAKQAGGPDTVDGIAPAGDWQRFWQDTAAAKRAGCAWLQNSAASLPQTP